MYTRNLFTQSALAAAVIATFMPAANAASDAEVAALRNEVAQLRALVMQQATTVNPNAPQSATGAPTSSIGNIAGDKALQQFGGAVTAQTQPQGFKLTTSNGAEAELYGILRADASYILEGNDNYTNNLPSVGAPGTPGNTQDKLNTSIQSTRFGFNFKSDNKDANKLAGKLEVDFVNGQNNSNGQLRVRHAFLTYNDWLLGQTKSTFLGYSPEMIDAGTNVGTGITRVPMVRYQHNLTPDTQVLVGLERGQSAGHGVSATYQLPALTARVNQNFAGKKGLATLRGLVESYDAQLPGSAAVAAVNFTGVDAAGNPITGTIPAKPAIAGKSDSMTGYGLGAGVNYKFTKQVEGFADVNYVKGNSGLVYGTTNAYAFDAAGNAQENEAMSWMLGGVFNINPKLRSTIGYSEVNFDDSTDYAKVVAGGTGAASNEKLRSMFANLTYSPVKQVDLGIEYHDGERKTFNGAKFNDDRVGLTAAYKF